MQKHQTLQELVDALSTPFDQNDPLAREPVVQIRRLLAKIGLPEEIVEHVVALAEKHGDERADSARSDYDEMY